jgi:hypothetical protein
VPDQARLLIRRKGQIDDLDRGILDQRLRRVVNPGDAIAPRDLLGARPDTRGECHDREAASR